MVLLTVSKRSFCILMMAFCCWFVATEQHDKCILSIGTNSVNFQPTEIEPCIAALFSPESYDVEGELWGMESLNYGCEKSQKKLTSEQSTIKVIQRGQCSFEQKTRIALEENFLGLIIIDEKQPVSAIGSSNASFVSDIPVVLIEKLSFYSVISSNSASRIKMHLYRKEKWSSTALPVLHEKLVEHIPVLKTELLVVLIVSLLTAMYYIWVKPTSSKIGAVAKSGHGKFIYRSLGWTLSFAIMIVAFVFSRIQTLRRLEPSEEYEKAKLEYPLLSGFHHTETDELIFEALIRNVHYSPHQYTLQGLPILSILNLARDNYDYALFIHPPLFVYVSSWLHYLCNIPLPVIPLLFQVGTFLCFPWLIGAVVEHIPSIKESFFRLFRVILRAGWLFMICPLCWFCSQKVWIDNALVFTCTLVLTCHFCWLSRANISKLSWLINHFLSGLMFGGITLNTKITGLALFPVFLLWSLWQSIERYEYLNRIEEEKNIKKLDGDSKVNNHSIQLCRQCIIEYVYGVSAFVLATAMGHAPWILWYHNKTGRWLPSAWPSAAMLAQSQFVRAAVLSRPWYFYVQQSATVFPLFLVAMVIGMCAIIASCISIVKVFIYRVDHKIDGFMFMMTILSSLIFILLSGMTVLGASGAGYQSRFLLPCSPIVAVVISLFLEYISSLSSSNNVDDSGMVIFVWVEQLIYLAIAISVITGWYYGVMYPTDYADLEAGGVFEALKCILTTALDRETMKFLYDIPQRQQAVSKMMKFHGYIEN